jgi:hypothetical protein
MRLKVRVGSALGEDLLEGRAIEAASILFGVAPFGQLGQ